MAADLAELRSQMEILREHGQARELDMQSSMLKAQERHDCLVEENNSRFASAIAKWESHCAVLKSMLPEGSASSPSSPGETVARMSAANVSKVEADFTVDPAASLALSKVAESVKAAGANY